MSTVLSRCSIVATLVMVEMEYKDLCSKVIISKLIFPTELGNDLVVGDNETVKFLVVWRIGSSIWCTLFK